MVDVESFTCGTPVIFSRLGAIRDLVAGGRTGLQFTARDPGDLARNVEWTLNHLSALSEMERAARSEYETRYTADKNHSLLMGIYQQTVALYA